ncbi:methyltransferase domain-containing protein [uncultured Bifidobacterium sp.]|uniref:class I SAM-dependent methyltransferase n=1 Tax=uncultured Bifidobacterium sp. TaxID=165187 RepID=UPI0028DD0687|nr:methyltransferase domain-containing protein [uncultured Bifidobacterium sp.]
MTWDADRYDRDQGFVSAYGRSLESLVPDDAGALLDLGCGTGTLTAELARRIPHVVGVDASTSMIDRARREHPGVEFHVADALDLPYDGDFDVVFSNAVFHWIHDHGTLLANVRRTLRPGGRLVCEFGARGNIARIDAAMGRAMRRRGLDIAVRFTFPGDDEFRRSLDSAGFRGIDVTSYDRPTPLGGGEAGLSSWLRQFYADDLAQVDEDERQAVIAEVEDGLRDDLWDASRGCWVADYRRLRAVAVR